MRPRVFPAEDIRKLARLFNQEVGCFNEAAGIPRGRRGARRTSRGRRAWASMRPRVFPAEDALRLRLPRLRLRDASMRPRVFPAEDLHRTPSSASTRNGFNEAAGIPRGRQYL